MSLFDWLVRLLQPRDTARAHSTRHSAKSASASSARGPSSASDDYFATMAALQEAVARRDFEQAAALTRRNLTQIARFVRSYRAQYGSFDIQGIRALEVGGTVLALAGDDDGLAEMQALVRSMRALEPWRDVVDRHVEDRRLVTAIREAVSAEPGCRQRTMKERLGASDGRRISTLLSWMEKARQLTRVKQGKDYTLWLPGAAPATPATSTSLAPPVGSHRTDRKPPRIQVIDVARLPYVPLPRAPRHWEQEQARQAAILPPTPSDPFEVQDAPQWRVASTEKLPLVDRPDPAFRRLFPVNTGLLAVDDLGNADGFGNAPAAALRYNRKGALEVRQPLKHGVYRLSANPLGQGFIALSKAAVVHAYGDDLALLFETALRDAPEIAAARKRFAIADDQLKNHVRCVALSASMDRYLFTIVDQAWCIGTDGHGLWGAQLPIKEEWTRLAEPSDVIGTTAEVSHALEVLGLSIPFSPEDVKTRYRQLAKQWHPDLNPDDPAATERMQALTAAAQLVTGISGSALPMYAGATYGKELQREAFDVGNQRVTVTMSMEVSEIHAADWIYAANFGGTANNVFLAGYSGRVVALSGDGTPLRVYDIGAVPHQIIDTDDYLYLLTDTRLYVLRDDSLCALVDIYEGGDLLMAQTGFGLLESKRLRWFSEDGAYRGSILSKDPIRRVYFSQEGLTVETRTRRAIIQGPPHWWE